MVAICKSKLSGRLCILLTLVVVVVLAWPIWRWAFVDAVWSGDAQRCRDASGACWSFVRQRLNFLFFGFYPPEFYGRSLAVVGIGAATVLAVTYVKHLRSRLSLVYFSILLAFVLSVCLLKGDGVLLADVPSRLWTGFTLTVTIALGGVALGLALGIVLALGRNFGGVLVATTCTLIIEMLRALPSVVTMFMIVVISPYLLPPVLGESMFLRIICGFVLVAGAFYAEALRGALLTLGKGQAEAAQSLGMKRFTLYFEIILPQVVALSFPAVMNVSLMVFKDTVLILALGYYELLGAANASINTQEWRGFAIEMFVFIYIVFWLCCSLVSRAGRAVENSLYIRIV
ncbi:amino acid ABC transporter permease [Labrys neptuniae]